MGPGRGGGGLGLGAVGGGDAGLLWWEVSVCAGRGEEQEGMGWWSGWKHGTYSAARSSSPPLGGGATGKGCEYDGFHGGMLNSMKACVLFLVKGKLSHRGLGLCPKARHHFEGDNSSSYILANATTEHPAVHVS